jgi:hypothetical protein
MQNKEVKTQWLLYVMSALAFETLCILQARCAYVSYHARNEKCGFVFSVR